MNAFKAVDAKTRKSKVFEGLERQFRRFLADLLFDKVLGWKGHSVVGERYDVTLVDDEGFPAILVETKWPDVQFADKEKKDLKRHLNELSTDYGVFANSVRFLVLHFNREHDKLIPIADIDVSDVVFRVDQKIPIMATQKSTNS